MKEVSKIVCPQLCQAPHPSLHCDEVEVSEMMRFFYFTAASGPLPVISGVITPICRITTPFTHL